MNIGEINLSEKKQIFILISTYNGEEYLDEQLKSIYDQTYTNFAVYVRDDGSQDLTKDILNRYEKKYDNFQWFSGRNIGTSKSFFSIPFSRDGLDVVPSLLGSPMINSSLSSVQLDRKNIANKQIKMFFILY